MPQISPAAEVINRDECNDVHLINVTQSTENEVRDDLI